MKILTLMKRLNKLKYDFKVVEYDDFNYSINFKVNGKNCFADCDTDNVNVNFFGIEGDYDCARQETDRRFYNSFAQLIRRANRR